MTCYDSIKNLLFPLKIYSFDEGDSNTCELLSLCFSLDKIDALLDEIANESFIQTAESYGLDLREYLFADKTKDSLTTDNRRNMLQSLYRLSENDFSADGIRNSLLAVGVYAKTIIENYSDSLIYVSIDNFKNEYINFEQLKRQIEALLPAHLDVYIDSGILTWDMFNEKDYSFDQLEELIPEWNFFEKLGHTI